MRRIFWWEGNTSSLSHGDKKSINDFYLLGGVLISFEVTDRFFVRINGLFGFNLTPEFMPDSMVPGLDYSGWIVKAGLSAGFKVASF